MMIEIQCPECGVVKTSSGDQFHAEKETPNEGDLSLWEECHTILVADGGDKWHVMTDEESGKYWDDFPEVMEYIRAQDLTPLLQDNGDCETYVMFGDWAKGGRPATEEETSQLAGTQEDGVPKGLTRCTVCGEWKGECLDPNPLFEGLVMTCHCLCDADLCSRCGHPLYKWKLGASFYDETDGRICSFRVLQQ